MYKIMLKTFILIFLAELGDKTQLSTMLLTSKTNSPLPVFIGSASALILSSFLGVTLGNTLSIYLPPNFIKIGAGVYFVIMGIILLLGK